MLTLASVLTSLPRACVKHKLITKPDPHAVEDALTDTEL